MDTAGFTESFGKDTDTEPKYRGYLHERNHIENEIFQESPNKRLDYFICTHR